MYIKSESQTSKVAKITSSSNGIAFPASFSENNAQNNWHDCYKNIAVIKAERLLPHKKEVINVVGAFQ